MRLNNMKKLSLSLALILIFAVALSACGGGEQANTKFFNITTGGTGGTYYPVGGAIAMLLTDNLEDLTVTAQAGNASVANCNLIAEHETESALVQNNVAFWAYNGIGTFEGQKIENLRGIASLYPEAIQIIALKDSNINSIEDLKGKKVSVGEQGSGVDFDVRNILAAHDMTYDDFDVDYLSFSESAQKLKDKQIDAAFVTAGYPTSSVMDVALSREIVLVPISEEKIEKMIETSPYYAKTVIPGGTYQGVDEDTVTATTMAMWVVDADADEELVYQMTKTMWENRTVLEEAHEKGKDITLETGLDGMGIPLHPGAERYYTEAGLK